MQMADGDQGQVAQFGLGLAEAQEGPAAHVDKNLRVSINPEEITG
jgi:hypothetical protein